MQHTAAQVGHVYGLEMSRKRESTKVGRYVST